MTAYRATWQAGAAPASVGAREPASDEALFQLADLVRIFHARLDMILSVAIVFVALTLAILILLPTLYSASSVIMLDSRKNSVADQSSVLSALPTDPASVQNQIQVLASRDLASRVIDNLQLWNDPEFNWSLNPSLYDTMVGALLRHVAPEREHDAIITAFLKRLTVDTQGLSTTFTITFTSQSPKKAARIANAIADSYATEQVNAKTAAASKAALWLAGRVRQLSDQVQTDEAAVQQYKADNNLSEAADGTSLIDQQTAAINAQLVQANSDLAGKQAVYDRVTTLIKEGNGGDISQVVASPLIVQLRTQQADMIRQEAQLSSRYGPLHPKMIDIESQKRNLEEKIAQEVRRIASSVANDVVVARAQVRSLELSLKQAVVQTSSDDMARVKLKALEASAASTRAMYESFVSRLREAQDQEAIQLPDSQIISRALVPVNASSPHRLLIFAAAVPAGLLLGLLFALLAERFAPAMQTARPAGLFRGFPVIGEIPDTARLNRMPIQATDRIVDQTASMFARAVDSLVAKIVRSQGSKGARIVALTSAEPGEGKTTLALGLARAASRQGLKVIVIDGDLNRPAVARAMGLSATQKGLLDALTGVAPLSHCMVKDPRSNVLALTGAQCTNNIPQVFASRAMAQLVAHLRRTCDLVIIDTTPVLTAAETPFTARLADVVLMVVRWNGKPRHAVDQAIEAIAAMRLPPVGIVLAL